MAPVRRFSHTAGLVLAGGRSSRFGSDKAAAQIDGKSFLDLAVTGLRSSCRIIAVSAFPSSVAASSAANLGLNVLADRPGDPPGPLAGIRAGLDWARTQGVERVAVRPVDTPFLAQDIFERLAEAIADAPAAYCVTDDGPQPLCALWTLASLSRLDEILAEHRHPSVFRLLDDIGAVRLKVEEWRMFANLNTADEFAQAQAKPAN